MSLVKNSLVGLQVAERALLTVANLETELHEIGLQTDPNGTSGPIILVSSANSESDVGSIQLVASNESGAIGLYANGDNAWLWLQSGYEDYDAITLEATGVDGGVTLQTGPNGYVVSYGGFEIEQGNSSIYIGGGGGTSGDIIIGQSGCTSDVNIATDSGCTGVVTIGNPTGNVVINGNCSATAFLSSVNTATANICNSKVGSVEFSNETISGSSSVTYTINNNIAGSYGLVNIYSPNDNFILGSVKWNLGSNIIVTVHNLSGSSQNGDIAVTFMSLD